VIFILKSDAPIFIVRPSKFIVLDILSKTTVNPTILRCIVDSFPRAKISWYRYGEKISEGSHFHLENITSIDQQGVYSYRVETDGFDPIQDEFIIYIKGVDRDHRSRTWITNER
jgi:hypothetical protein